MSRMYMYVCVCVCVCVCNAYKILVSNLKEAITKLKGRRD